MAAPFQQLVDKLITDPTFRKQFKANRIAAVESLGVTMTPALQKALDNLPVQQITAVAIAMEGPADFT
jgi:hypothetical protein